MRADKMYVNLSHAWFLNYGLPQTKDPKAVQPHLGKCFENIVTLEFEKNLDITAMYSGEKERVDFLNKIVPTSQVEQWLLLVETQVRALFFLYM